MQITAESVILDTLKEAPATRDVFKKYDLKCHYCSCNQSDRVKDAATNCGVDLETLLKELNEAANGSVDE